MITSNKNNSDIPDQQIFKKFKPKRQMKTLKEFTKLYRFQKSTQNSAKIKTMDDS